MGVLEASWRREDGRKEPPALQGGREADRLRQMKCPVLASWREASKASRRLADAASCRASWHAVLRRLKAGCLADWLAGWLAGLTKERGHYCEGHTGNAYLLGGGAELAGWQLVK